MSHKWIQNTHNAQNNNKKNKENVPYRPEICVCNNETWNDEAIRRDSLQCCPIQGATQKCCC